jgi:lambda family phage portal protein
MRMPAWLSRLLPGRAGTGRRRFDAAQYNRLTHSWIASERSINTELRADLDALRRRSRDLAKNSPLAKKFLQMVASNVVGPRGFALQARVVNPDGSPDKLANDAIEAGYADWSKARNCDIGKRLSFRAQCRAIALALARDGEALVRERQGAANPYGYALQVLDVERLDTTLNREPADGKNQIIMGVEQDADGVPVAYWLASNPLGRDPTGKKLQRIPAGEILHLFMTDDPEQVRGVPWMHAVMLTVNDLKGYNHAAIVAARIGASKMGFFTSPDGDPTPVKDGEDSAGMPFTEADPGQFGMLPPGYDFKSFDPDYPHANYAAFVKEHKRDVASGFGVAYNTLANDLEGVNFSSIRSGTLEERDNWMAVQQWFIDAFLDVIYERWLDNALLAGALIMPNGSPLPASKRAKFGAHEFQGRRWSWVDPLKDIEASVRAIENGLASPYTIAAQQGVDAEDVLDDIARFQAAAKAKGVILGAPAPATSAPEPPPDDGTKTLNLAAARALMDAKPVENHYHLPPPPAVTVTSPEIRNDIVVQPAAAPVVEIRNEQAAPVVQVDVHVPQQAAPVVEVRVEPTPVTLEAIIQPADVALSLPARKTETIIHRQGGEMTGSTAIETDA